MNFKAAFSLVLFFVATTSVEAIEEPSFNVLETIGEVEIRLYEGYWVAQTQVSGNFAEAGNQAFRPLVDYLSGENESGAKISMTAPVQQRTVADQYVVTFVMPQDAVAGGLPDPKDGAVSLDQVPSQVVAALRYSGGWQESRYRKFEQQLVQQLQQSRYVICGAPTWARYNPPFWPGFLRRNEVLIPVAVGDCGTSSED